MLKKLDRAQNEATGSNDDSDRRQNKAKVCGMKLNTEPDSLKYFLFLDLKILLNI